MTKRFAIGTMLTLCLPILALAQQGLTGTWEGQTGNGNAIVLTLKAEKTALTGTLKRNEDAASPITDGKISKNTFTFKGDLGGQVEGFSGEHTGDEIKVWLERQGPERAITLRRAKPKAKDKE